MLMLAPGVAPGAGYSKDAYSGAMSDLTARELRNDVSGVLRRVEAGERLRVTMRGRPVAQLIPLPGRRESLSWDEFVRGAEDWRADPGLSRDLRDLLPETTDDVPIS